MLAGQRGNRLDINLTPLLDLVLQLIMFFMLTVNFVRVDRANEEVDLPVVQSAMPLQNRGDNLVYITIAQNGERRASGTMLQTAEQLRDFLRGRKNAMDDAAQQHGLSGPVAMIVVVRAHKDTSWGEVWDTLDQCQQAGCQRWQLRVIKQAA